MADNKIVDYFQAMRDFDRSQKKKADGFIVPLNSSEAEPVDYLVVSREYEKYLIENHSEVIHVAKE